MFRGVIRDGEDCTRPVAGTADICVVWPNGAVLGYLEGDDYFGPALNRAARVMAVGHGGQILVAESTAALIDRVLRSEDETVWTQVKAEVEALARTFPLYGS